MSEEQAVEQKAVQEQAPVAPVSSSPIEEIAREGGWSPKEEWRGDPERWKPAEVFVKEGIKIQAKQHDKIDRLVNKVESVENNIREMAKGEAQRTKRALEAQRERIMAERQEAFEESDTEKFNKADKELMDTDIELRQVDERVMQAAQQGEDEFKKNNPWYGTDPAMTAHAELISTRLPPMQHPEDAKEFYGQLERAVKSAFPDEFQNANRNKPGAVSGDRNKSTQTVSGADAATPEQRAAFNEISTYMPDYTLEQYMKDSVE